MNLYFYLRVIKILNFITDFMKERKYLVELWRIELQSETKLPTTSTCLEKLFDLILLHTTCKATQDEPQRFVLGRDTPKIYLHEGLYFESCLSRVNR